MVLYNGIHNYMLMNSHIGISEIQKSLKMPIFSF